MQRVVIVTPSVYGTDNAATLYSLVSAQGMSHTTVVVTGFGFSEGDMAAKPGPSKPLSCSSTATCRLARASPTSALPTATQSRTG